MLTIDSAALENSCESSAAAAVHRHRRFPKGLVGIQVLEVQNVSSFYRCCYGYVWLPLVECDDITTDARSHQENSRFVFVSGKASLMSSSLENPSSECL